MHRKFQISQLLQTTTTRNTRKTSKWGRKIGFEQQSISAIKYQRIERVRVIARTVAGEQ